MVVFHSGTTGPSQDLRLSQRDPTLTFWGTQIRLPCYSMLVLDILTLIILSHGFSKIFSTQVVFKICHPSSCINFGTATTNTLLHVFILSVFARKSILVGLGELFLWWYFHSDGWALIQFVHTYIYNMSSVVLIFS